MSDIRLNIRGTLALLLGLSIFTVGCKEPADLGIESLTNPYIRPRIIFTYPVDNGQGPFNLYTSGYTRYDSPHFIIRFNKYMFTPTAPGAVAITGFDEATRISLFPQTQQFTDVIGFSVEGSEGYRLVYELGTTYTVTVDTSIQDINGNRMATPFTFSFKPEPYFRVTSVYPFDGDTILYLSNYVNVYFNSPVTSGILPYLRLIPQASGAWRLNGFNEATSVYFEPQGSFPFSTAFSIMVYAGASDKHGNRMVSEYRSSFVTTSFHVTSTYPSNGSGNAPLDNSIFFSFSGPIDTNTVRPAFSASPPLTGDFLMYSSSFSFRPSSGLLASTQYSVMLSTALRAGDGTALSGPYTLSFFTVSFQVTNTSPSDGQTGVGRSAPVLIYLTGTPDTTTVGGAFSVTPTIPGSLSAFGSSLRFLPDSSLAARQTYSVAIATTLRSRAGSILAFPYTFSFTTGN